MYICGYGSSVCILIPQSIVYFECLCTSGGDFVRGDYVQGGLCPGFGHYIQRWFSAHRLQAVTHPSTNLTVHGRESNSQSVQVDHKHDALTSAQPSYDDYATQIRVMD